MFNTHIRLDQPAFYQVKIQGQVQDHLGDWFLDSVRYHFENDTNGETVTILTGQVADQSALHGLLNRIRDLGLVLLSVDCLSARGVEPQSGMDQEKIQ